MRRKQTKVEETGENGEKITKWAYEEAEMNRKEYDAQQNELNSPLAKAIMQNNTEIIAQNELLQIQIEILMEMITPAEGE